MYKLKYLRESELLTQKQVAEKIFCGQRAYSYYETGERDIPTQTLVYALQTSTTSQLTIFWAEQKIRR